MTTVEEPQETYGQMEQQGSPMKSSIILERQQGPIPTQIYSPARTPLSNNVTVTNSLAYRPSFAPPINNYNSLPTSNNNIPAYLTSPSRTTMPTYITSPYRLPLVTNTYQDREDPYVKPPLAGQLSPAPYAIYSPGRRTSYAPVYAQQKQNTLVDNCINYSSYNMAAPVSPMYSPMSPNIYNPVPPRNPTNNILMRPQTTNTQYSPASQRRDSSYLGGASNRPGVPYGRTSVAPSYGNGTQAYNGAGYSGAGYGGSGYAGGNGYSGSAYNGASYNGSGYGGAGYGGAINGGAINGGGYGSIRMTCTDQVGRLGKKPKRR